MNKDYGHKHHDSQGAAGGRIWIVYPLIQDPEMGCLNSYIPETTG